MYELALFAGAGGGLLATKWLLGWRTVCYVENAAYPAQVLQARIRDGLLDDAPIWDDAHTFDGTPWRGCVDIVTAGFPCQPFSGAGKGLADRDPRNLWPDTARIIREVRPRFVFLENVPNLRCPIRRDGNSLPSYFGRVLGDLAESGYDVRWDCIPASAIGANHQRDRLWIVAHANNGCSQRAQDKIRTGRHTAELCCENVAYSTEPRLEGTPRQRMPAAQWTNVKLTRSCKDVANANSRGCKRNTHKQEGKETVFSRSNPTRESLGQSTWWQVEPQLGRVVDGLAHRVDRLAAIGEGQVPTVAATAWQLLTSVKGTNP